MKITCNGQIKNIDPGTTPVTLIQDLDLNPDTVVVECDGRIVKREEYDTLILTEGNIIELVRFVGGG